MSTDLVIAGLGLVGRRHADAIKHVGGARLIAIVDPSETGQRHANDLGLDVFDDLDTMFRQKKPDGVVLATPTLLHVEQARECVGNGCPVLIEKPIAVEAHDAEELVSYAESENVPLLVGHHRRHNPIVQKARHVIETGGVGEVRAIHSTCWFYKPNEYFEVAPWRKKKGAGPISVNLVHDVDLIRSFCGEVTSVFARAKPSRRDFENEDVAAAILTFENGAIGTISVSDSIASPWSWELTSGEYPVYPRTSESCYTIGGSKGSLSVPDLHLWSHEKSPDWWTPISAKSLLRNASDPLCNQIEHFCRVVQGLEDPIVSGREGLKTLRVVEAIQQSANSNIEVAIART